MTGVPSEDLAVGYHWKCWSLHKYTFYELHLRFTVILLLPVLYLPISDELVVEVVGGEGLEEAPPPPPSAALHLHSITVAASTLLAAMLFVVLTVSPIWFLIVLFKLIMFKLRWLSWELLLSDDSGVGISTILGLPLVLTHITICGSSWEEQSVLTAMKGSIVIKALVTMFPTQRWFPNKGVMYC